jgi:hypothetical protein
MFVICLYADLPELDENIFEYLMQLLEHQCLVAIRQKNYEDTIQCDACHRVNIYFYFLLIKIRIQIDNVDDLIQCVQCKTIVHKVNSRIIEYLNQILFIFRNVMDSMMIEMNGHVIHVNIIMIYINVVYVRKLEEY